MNQLGINLFGHLTAADGLGEAGRSTLRAIDAVEMPCAIIDRGQRRGRHHAEFPEIESRFTLETPYQIDLVHINPNFIDLAGDELDRSRRQRRYRIGFWLWETPIFPAGWMDFFELFDEVWTSSLYCVEAISRVSPIPVIRIPHTIEVPKTEPVGAAIDLPERSFIFLFVFDFLSSSSRKNPVATINAFLRAFGPDDDRVTLVIKTTNADKHVESMREMQEAIGGAENIVSIEGRMQSSEVYALMNRADCYVSLHRSEGFGLTIAEAMYLGKPVIATAHSGNMDFMTPLNSYPISYKIIPANEMLSGHEFYFGRKDWADPDVDEAAARMREVFEDRDKAAGKGALAAQTIRTLLSPMAVGNLIAARVERIAAFKHWSNTYERMPIEKELAELKVYSEFFEKGFRRLTDRVAWMEERFVWKLRKPWHHLKRNLFSR